MSLSEKAMEALGHIGRQARETHRDIGSVPDECTRDRLRIIASTAELARAALLQAAREEASPPDPQARIEALEGIARAAAAQFRFYAESHSAKGTPDGDAKARTNIEWAERLERATLNQGAGDVADAR